MKEFPTVFDGQVRTMPGEVFKIVLTEDAKPFCVNTPQTLPYACMGPTKDELKLLESQGIIAKQTEPTDRCAPIVVTQEKNSERIRLSEDFSRLTRQARIHPPSGSSYEHSRLQGQVLHCVRCRQRCEERGISLNREKLHFSQEEVEFAGFHLSPDGYLISDDIHQ